MVKPQKARKTRKETFQDRSNTRSNTLLTQSPDQNISQAETQSEGCRYSYGFLLAPGSSVWPANMTQVGRPSTGHKNGAVGMPKPAPRGGRGRGRGHGVPSGKLQSLNVSINSPSSTSPSAREGVGTRRTVGHAGDVDVHYEALMNQKIKYRREGQTSQADRIQAAVNVGVVLGWTKADVLEVIENMKEYLREKAEDEERVVEWDDKLVALAAEEELLGFKRNARVEEEEAWKGRALLNVEGKPRNFEYEKLRFLRFMFSPKNAAQVAAGQLNLHAPLLLVKIQAALNVAMEEFVMNHGSSNDEHDQDCVALELQNFDAEVFKHKAAAYLFIPSKRCGEEITHLLRNSKAAKHASEDSTDKGEAPKVYRGIDTSLAIAEKQEILETFSGICSASSALLEALLNVLPLVDENGTAYGGPVRSTRWKNSNRAVCELSDEGFLVLSFLHRKFH